MVFFALPSKALTDTIVWRPASSSDNHEQQARATHIHQEENGGLPWLHGSWGPPPALALALYHNEQYINERMSSVHV